MQSAGSQKEAIVKSAAAPTAPFYGWWVVLASSLILFISSGIGFYAHGVILEPLGRLHGWSRGTVSSAVTLYFFTSGLIGIALGRSIDRHGPRVFLVAGALCMGGGLWLLGRIGSVAQLYGVYMLLSVGFVCTARIPANALVANWFVRRRGLAMSLSETGLSVGGVLLVPAVSWLVVHRGVNATLPLLGALYALVVIPVTLLLVKRRPADFGQFPDGDDPADPPGSVADHGGGPSPPEPAWTRRRAMRTAAFWAIAAAFLLALGGQISFLVHQVSFLGGYVGPQMAATAVSVTAGASIVGRLLLGTLADRFDNRALAMAFFLLQGLAVLVLAHQESVPVLYACTLVFGLTMGPILVLQSLITAECFGRRSFATVSGSIGLFTMPGAALGPAVAGAVYDAFGSYRAAFSLFALASFLAVVIVRFARPPR